MADPETVRRRIITSLFTAREPDGTLEKTYITHLKIWENDGSEGGRKPRYILLAQGGDGSTFVHKSKLNTNGTFSIGKTWKLTDLRSVEVVNRTAFNVTLARTYKWETEVDRDQESFLEHLVRLFRDVTGGSAPLRLIGFSVPDNARASQREIARPNTASTSSVGPALVPPRRVQADQYDTPSSSYSNRGPVRDVRPSSPTLSSRSGMPSPFGSPATNHIRAESPTPVPSSHTYVAPAMRSRNGSPSRTRPASPSSMSHLRRIPSPVSHRASAGTPPIRSSLSIAERAPPTSIPGSTPPLRRADNISARSELNQNLTQSRLSVDRPPSSYRNNSQQSSLAQSVPSYTPGAPFTKSRDGINRSDSPAPSISSKKSHAETRPSRTTTPAPPFSDRPPLPSRRDPNSRISFFDPSNQVLLDRLLADDGQSVGEEGIAQTTMANIEEMLEGYEWASDDMLGRKRAQGAADQIEARLLDELTMLDKAIIHSFLESDDRIATVLKYIDDADRELENMGTLVSSYKIHLNSVSDDISYIQSQNKGLQVQTQNQKALLSELEQLLQTVHVDRETLLTLTQESLEKTNSIQELEIAAADLYKALLAGRDNDMAATMERLQEYRTHNLQFCKRLVDFLSIMFKYQGDMLLGKHNGIQGLEKGRPAIVTHQPLEAYLGRYSGLMLYLKEMDEDKYSKICAIYFSAASDIHTKQIKALSEAYGNLLKKPPEEDIDQAFAPTPTSAGFRSTSGIRRAGTIVRSPLESRRDKDKDKKASGTLVVSEALSLLLEQMATQVYREEDFIADFLQINDAALTYADFMGLEQYFRRQAARHAGLSSSTAKLVRGAMDLIFGFLPAQLKTWIDSALSRDNIQIVGLVACVERTISDAEERGNVFFSRLLENQHQRLKSIFDRHIDEQVKLVEDTKLTAKKRKGLAPFIKYFPVYLTRVESQLKGAESLEIRGTVDAAYERIVKTMFDSLKHMAKLDGDDEDKGQLNYHVIIIDNMHFFIEEMGQQEIATINTFRKRAESIYEENLSAYVKIVVRRPFAKIIDYFEGVERLLKTTAPTEVSKNSTYNRSALKRVIKEYNAKDVRKHIDTLFKRVEKHFSETTENATNYASVGVPPGTVLAGVWKACEEEVMRITDLFGKRISQCYVDVGLSLEYTVADIEGSFKRHRVGS